MKTRLNLFGILFFLPLFLVAQFDCGDQYFSLNGNMINLTPEMFSYYENPYGDNPLGPSGVGNLADEQALISEVLSYNGTTYPGGPSEVWNDYNYTGILDMGTDMDLSAIYLAVGPETDPTGIIRITAGKIGTPEYDENDILVEINFQYLECSRIYEFDLTNLVNVSSDVYSGIQHLTIERIQALETITEMAIIGTETPAAQIEISGCIKTECGEPIPSVVVELLENPTTGGTQQMQTTNQDGCYSFTNLNSGSDYFVFVSKSGQTTCGLDVYDRIAIQNHTFGSPLIGTPFGLLAADVNNDHVVDFLDYEYLSAMFVNNGNTSFSVDWKFVSDNIILSPTAPFNQATGSFSYPALTTSQVSQNFTGVKTGDVVCSYTDACPEVNSGISLSGCVLTECNVPVPGAEVELIEIFSDGTIAATLTDFAITNASGCYEFFRRTPGSQYIVTIAKGNQLGAGVGSSDLSILQNHILFVSPILGPLDLLAGDLNGNGIINISDLVLANFLVVGDNASFLMNGGIAWTFVRRGHVFSNPTNPFAALPLNFYNLATYNTNQSSLDFTAIKNGDLDCSYPSSSAGPGPGPGSDPGGDEGGRRSDNGERLDSVIDKMIVKAQPNPFKESTNLNLELNEDGPVMIRVYNLLGKEIFSEERILGAGTHSISLDRLPQNASGVLTYVIEQNGNIVSGKMIKIN